MKAIFLCYFIFICPISMAQELEEIQGNLHTVETSKATFRQDLKASEDNTVQYSVVEIDSKGREREITYNFSFADIDVNTVRSLTQKDVIIVQLLVKGKQKLVKVNTDGGDKISYSSQLQLLATDSKNGHQLESLLKIIIPIALADEEKRLSLSGYNEHMSWLVNNLFAVELPNKQIIQKASGDNISGKFTLDQTFNLKNKSRNKLVELNLGILNPNSLAYKINGDEFIIGMESRRGINGFRFFEDGEQKNYTNRIELYANSIVNGKDIFNVLKKLIPLAQKSFEDNQVDVSSTDKALLFLNSVISEVGTSEESLIQNLTITEQTTQFKVSENGHDESTEYIYQFNFADINVNNIDFDGQKDRLFVVLPTKKALNFIQKKQDGELENYRTELKIYFNTIEDAITGAKALKTLVENHEALMEAQTYETISISNWVEALKKHMSKVHVDETVYDLFLEIADATTNTVKLTSVASNLKKSTETVHEFSLNDINPKNCSIEVKGKNVMVLLRTKHLEKTVKTYLDGDIKPYENKVTITANGIESARNILGIITHSLDKN